MGDRLRFALSRTTAEHWLAFEHLASTYLTDEYGQLRTLASASGDGGRDAELWEPANDPNYALQYSVEKNWNDKIRRSLRKIQSKHPNVHTLIYACPQEIGADGDELKKDSRSRYGVQLDIRDGHWFAVREMSSGLHSSAADDYCRKVIDFELPTASSLDRTGAALNNHEAQAALVYLALQREDDEQDRQLTKQCFDALVKSVLRDTDPERRRNREEIVHDVHSICPSQESQDIGKYVDSALGRLSRKGESQAVRFYKDDDSFCLSYPERQRLGEGLARMAVVNDAFDQEIEEKLRFVAEGLGDDLSFNDVAPIVLRIRRVMEQFLLERGEAFVVGLATGRPMLFAGAEITEVARHDLLQHADTTGLRHTMEQLVAETIERILIAPSHQAQDLLRSIADAYTLLAFLRESPNVQQAVSKLFTHGDIWLDTSAVLPLLAEELLDPQLRGYSKVFDAALDAGVTFYVTEGVVDEIERHIQHSLFAWRSPGSWRSRTPFLLSAYVWSGQPREGFPSWIETFRGSVRPVDDVSDFLQNQRRIKVKNLQEFVERAPDEVRWQTDLFWQSVHEARRKRADDKAPDEVMIRELSRHDVENFLGVIERRKKEHSSTPFGYASWWLTLDSYARDASVRISAECGVELPSPVISFDFLNYYLAVAPARRQLKKNREKELPLALDSSLVDATPQTLLDAADEVRRAMSGKADHVIARHVRDHLDREKLRNHRVGKTNLESIEDDLHFSLSTQQSKRKHPTSRS